MSREEIEKLNVAIAKQQKIVTDLISGGITNAVSAGQLTKANAKLDSLIGALNLIGPLTSNNFHQLAGVKPLPESAVIPLEEARATQTVTSTAAAVSSAAAAAAAAAAPSATAAVTTSKSSENNNEKENHVNRRL